MRSIFLFCLCFAALTSFAQSYKLADGHKISFTNPDVSGTFDELSATSIVFDETEFGKCQTQFQN